MSPPRRRDTEVEVEVGNSALHCSATFAFHSSPPLSAASPALCLVFKPTAPNGPSLRPHCVPLLRRPLPAGAFPTAANDALTGDVNAPICQLPTAGEPRESITNRLRVCLQMLLPGGREWCACRWWRRKRMMMVRRRERRRLLLQQFRKPELLRH